jgi:hypothetical protein
MNQLDKQRIADAIWTLQHYSDELFDMTEGFYINGTRISPYDALRILEEARIKIERGDV